MKKISSEGGTDEVQLIGRQEQSSGEKAENRKPRSSEPWERPHHVTHMYIFTTRIARLKRKRQNVAQHKMEIADLAVSILRY